MTNNDLMGSFIAGFAVCLVMIGIFQIGINIGIKTCIHMLDDNYPAAMKFILKHKNVGKLLPYVISQGE